MTVITDGTFDSEEISIKAAENNIEMVPTGLVGRTQESNLDYTGFVIDEGNHEVLKCREHCVPLGSSYDADKGKYTVKFPKDICSNCSHRVNCPVNEQKKCYVLYLSEKKYHREQLIVRMGTDAYKEIADKRSDVEGIPSVLRRRYEVDHLPVKGLIR